MQNPSRREFVSGSLAAVAGALLPLTGSVAAEKPNDWMDRTEDVGVDRAAIRKILEDARSVTALRSIVVVKNGSVVGQQYYGGVTAADLQGVNSVTKSVASMLVGIAVQQGKIKSLSETVGNLLPTSAVKAPSEAALGITLEQILTDTSGLVYDFRTDMRALETAEDPIAFALRLRDDPQREGQWVYSDAAI